MAILAGLLLKVVWEFELERAMHNTGAAASVQAVEARSRLGQNLAIAMLSGFRGVVADFVWLRAHRVWEEAWDRLERPENPENPSWYLMEQDLRLAVTLQPHSIAFWDIGSWHMAWNISYGEGKNRNHPSQLYRDKVARDWVLRGQQFLEEGIRNNPDNYELHFRLGFLLYFKRKDPLGAIPHLKKAAGFPEAPLYVGRMIGHMHEKGGRKREAYEWWKKLWLEDHSRHPQQLWEKIEKWGRESEEKLDIPTAERVFPRRSTAGTTGASS